DAVDKIANAAVVEVVERIKIVLLRIEYLRAARFRHSVCDKQIASLTRRFDDPFGAYEELVHVGGQEDASADKPDLPVSGAPLRDCPPRCEPQQPARLILQRRRWWKCERAGDPTTDHRPHFA